MGYNMDIIQRLTGYGKAQRTGRHLLADVALDLAHSAAHHEIDESDAMRCYLVYLKASTGAKADPADRSVRVNASKMRQIIKAADPELLQRVMSFSDRIPFGRRRSMYAAMVDACRLQLNGRRVTNGVLRKLLTM